MRHITAWVRTLLPDDPAFKIPVEDDTILQMAPMEHNMVEKLVQKQCYDALVGGYHGIKEEKKHPGYKFDLAANSRYGWVPHGAIYDWCKKKWAEALTEQIFWNMILHTKND